VAPISIALIAFVFMLAGILLGIYFQHVLPQHHLSAESKDVVKLSMGVVATLAALVLGLLVASAKTSYEARESEVKQITAYLIIMDQLLEQYGPDAQAARVNLRQVVAPMADRIWSEGTTGEQSVPFKANAESEAFYRSIQDLQPQNDNQRDLKARILQLYADAAQARMFLFTRTGSTIPTLFLGVLIFWLTILFTGFSLTARPNPTVITALLVCALTAAGAIFLVLELDQPFLGMIALPDQPLRNALAPLSG
jgi:hypothetical protein